MCLSRIWRERFFPRSAVQELVFPKYGLAQISLGETYHCICKELLMLCVRRTTSSHKEGKKDGNNFLCRKEERRISECVRRACHQAMMKVRNAEKVEKEVISRLKLWGLQDQLDVYLEALPEVLRKIKAVKRN